MARISKKKVKKAIKASGGVQAVVAKAIGVTRQSMSVYFKKNPDMRSLLDEEAEQIMDVAEHNLDKKIVDGDVEVSKWALTNRKKGKARGYGLKQEVEHSGDIIPTTFNLIEKSIEEIKDEKVRGKPEQTIDNKSEASGDAESPRGQ